MCHYGRSLARVTFASQMTKRLVDAVLVDGLPYRFILAATIRILARISFGRDRSIVAPSDRNLVAVAGQVWLL